jgi:hypothetical protein
MAGAAGMFGMEKLRFASLAPDSVDNPLSLTALGAGDKEGASAYEGMLKPHTSNVTNLRVFTCISTTYV